MLYVQVYSRFCMCVCVCYISVCDCNCTLLCEHIFCVCDCVCVCVCVCVSTCLQVSQGPLWQRMLQVCKPHSSLFSHVSPQVGTSAVHGNTHSKNTHTHTHTHTCPNIQSYTHYSYSYSYDLNVNRFHTKNDLNTIHKGRIRV